MPSASNRECVVGVFWPCVNLLLRRTDKDNHKF